MLTDAIVALVDVPADQYRARQADFWLREADECTALGLDDLAASCRETAAGWRYGGAIDLEAQGA